MKIKRIEHVAIATRDLNEVIDLFRDKFGLAVEYTEELSQTKLAMIPVGDSYLELLSSSAPNSRTMRFLADKGQGLFHICFEVESLVDSIAELKDKDVRMLTETLQGHGNSRVAFIDPKSTGNILIELVELSKTSHAPVGPSVAEDPPNATSAPQRG